MKRIASFVAITAAMFFSFNAFAGSKVIRYEDLPKESKACMRTYFAEYDFLSAKQNGAVYEARFTEGSLLTFDKKGNLVAVNMESCAMPAEIVAKLPAGIQTYLADNYAGHGVEAFSSDKKGNYTVEVRCLHGNETVVLTPDGKPVE